MITRIRRQIAPTAQVSPPDLEAIVLARISRRARVSIPHAAVIASLAGIGPREARL